MELHAPSLLEFTLSRLPTLPPFFACWVSPATQVLHHHLLLEYGITSTSNDGIATSTSFARITDHISCNADYLIPFARSYDGNSWERVSAGKLAEGSISAIPPVLECSVNGACSVTISNDATYSLSKDTPSAPTTNAQASRLLQQATFGPNTESVAGLNAAIISKGAPAG